MSTLTVQPLTPAQVREFITWEYQEPYAMYNMNEEDTEAAVSFFTDPANGYFGIVNAAGSFLGFCNFGADARVPGGNYTDTAIDIGMGMHPDLTGQGKGASYADAVFEYANKQFAEQPRRVTIAEFNKRAQRLCQRFGFKIVDRFERPSDKRPFVVMLCPPSDSNTQ